MAKPQTNYISWAALIISIMALILAWNSDQSVQKLRLDPSRMSFSLNQTKDITQQQIDNIYTDTAEGLMQIQNQAENSVESVDISQGISNLRQNLASTYQNLQQESQVVLDQTDQELSQLQQQASSGAVDIIDQIQQYLEQIESEISSDSN